MPPLVCVSRESEGLLGLVLPEEEIASPLLRMPLARISGPGAEERASLLSSWEHLGRARGATADTLTHVLRILLHTVPGEPGPAPSLAHPWLEPPAPLHRRTAAHPRGYRGTLYQPPKRARPDVLDVRPYLLHRSTTSALLESLRAHGEEALQRLSDEGLSSERLGLVSRLLASSSRADVALAWRHGVLEKRAAELPPSLLRLACLLTPGAASEFGRLLALRGRLALETHPELLSLAARLLATWGSPTALGWLEVAASLAPESQRALFESLFQSKAAPFDSSRYDLRFEAFASQSAFWRTYYLCGLAAGLTSDYLLSGFRLLDTLGISRDYGLARELPGSSGPVPEECLRDLFDYVGPWPIDGECLVGLWALCGHFRGFAELLIATPWRKLSPAAASRLARELSGLWDPEEVNCCVWPPASRLHPRLLQSGWEDEPDEEGRACTDWGSSCDHERARAIEAAEAGAGRGRAGQGAAFDGEAAAPARLRDRIDLAERGAVRPRRRRARFRRGERAGWSSTRWSRWSAADAPERTSPTAPRSTPAAGLRDTPTAHRPAARSLEASRGAPGGNDRFDREGITWREERKAPRRGRRKECS